VGQAKDRGTFEFRKTEAIAAGRVKVPPVPKPPKRLSLVGLHPKTFGMVVDLLNEMRKDDEKP